MSVTFYLHSYKRRDGKRTVYYSVDGKQRSTHINVDPKNFSSSGAIGNWLILEDEPHNDSLMSIWRSYVKPDDEMDGSGMTIRAVMKAYLEHTQTNTAFGNYNKVRSHLAKFLRIVPFKALISDLNEDLIDAFITRCRKDGNGNSTINGNLKTIRAAMYWAIDRYDLNMKNPVRKIKVRPEPSERFKLTPQQVELLELGDRFTTLQRQAADMWLFMLYSGGMRIGDAMRIQMKDIEDGKLTYRASKTRKIQTIPMNPKLRLICDRLMYRRKNEKYLCPFTNEFTPPQGTEEFHREKTRVTCLINSHLKTLSKKIKVKHLTCHLARHTFSVMALNAGADIKSIQEILQHSNLRDTQRYLESLDENRISRTLNHMFQ